MRWFHNGLTRRVFGALALTALGLGLLLAPIDARAAEPACQDVRFPVRLAGLAQTVAGTLCTPAGGADTVQVLIPGGLYNRTYWDITVTPETRSFRRAMNRAGYATLAVDRLGSGDSTKPPSVLLTAITQADVMHQVIQSVRSGFAKVIVAGHSLGSAVAVIEAATYHDVDGVLVTGMSHHLNVLNTATIATTLGPAILDPKFAGRILDPGYLTTRPGSRFGSFHAPGPFDSDVERHDEVNKDLAAVTELGDAALFGTLTPYSLLINVPVLTVVASQDPVLCGALFTDCTSSATLLAGEKPFYSEAARPEAYLLDGYGHALNYARNAPDYFQAVVEWADRMVGS